jgi:hypothetical protein
MIVLAMLLCQALPASLFDEPSDFGTPQEVRPDEPAKAPKSNGRQRHPLEIRLGVETYAVYTVFQSSMRIDYDWGFGGDLKIVGDWGRTANLVLRLGYAGWNTQVDSDSLAFPASAQVRQYRIGVGIDFTWRVIDFGLGINSGAYYFHTKELPTDFVHSDTQGFFEMEATLGVKPAPFLKIGLIGMLTFTETGFNRPEGHSRLSVNESLGPSIELKFQF